MVFPRGSKTQVSVQPVSINHYYEQNNILNLGKEVC